MTENPLMTKAVEFEVNGEPVRLSGKTVREYLVRGNGEVDDQDVVMFINRCKYQKLNPFLNEAYLIKFGTLPSQMIVSKEAFMKRAEVHPQYRGFEAGIIVERDGELVEIEGAVKLKNDILTGGYCKVFRGDREKPLTTKISFEEFSKGQATWKQMPLNMIRKSAIVNALREAFPENLGAMYTEDDAGIRKDISPKEEVQEEIVQNANKGEVVDFDEPKQTIKQNEVVQDAVYEDVQEPQQQDIFEEGPGF